LSRLLDGDDVERLNHRVARQQVAGDLAERLRDRPVDVRGPRVIGLERVKDPVAVLADLERVPGDRALLGDSELAAGPQELGELVSLRSRPALGRAPAWEMTRAGPTDGPSAELVVRR
jgi:hypothetical protein